MEKTPRPWLRVRRTGIGLGGGIPKSQGGCDFEIQRRRVHFMPGAVDESHSDIDDGKAGQNSGFHRLPDTVSDGRYEFTRDGSAFRSIHKEKPLAPVERFDFDLGMSIMSPPSEASLYKPPEASRDGPGHRIPVPDGP
jgi:hypothetical protein